MTPEHGLDSNFRYVVMAARRARQEWLAKRLATLDSDKRQTLRKAADLILALVDESP